MPVRFRPGLCPAFHGAPLFPPPTHPTAFDPYQDGRLRPSARVPGYARKALSRGPGASPFPYTPHPAPPMTHMRQDARKALGPWLRRPGRRAKLEAVALGRCFVIHPQNNNFRKLTLLALVGMWVAVSLGAPTSEMFGTIPYTILTAFVFTIIGRQWGIEVSGIAPSIRLSDDEDDD